MLYVTMNSASTSLPREVKCSVEYKQILLPRSVSLGVLRQLYLQKEYFDR
jgi:hypothetical protein